MPPTRKSTRGSAARGSATGKQSTLLFTNRVSKAGAVKSSSKDKDAQLDSPNAAPPPSKKAKLEEFEKVEDQVNEQLGDDSQVEEAEDKAQIDVAEDKAQAEVRAEKITDAQIRKYWKGVEEARIAKRVHQEELGTGEKVLRYFDISSQYGVSLSCCFRPDSRRESLSTDGVIALHRHTANEALVPCRETGHGSADRGPGRAAEGKVGKCRD